MNFIEHPRLYRALGTLQDLDKDTWEEVEADIWQMFGATKAVLVIDMSHFTKVTKAHGIVYYLTLIKRMQDAVALSIPRHNGTLVKFLADNAFLIFEKVEDALGCIQEINMRVQRENQAYPEVWDVELCAGIDFGHILNINDNDLYGDAVNVASKLGEDSAEPWEVLISQRALTQVENKSQYKVEEHEVTEHDFEEPVFKLLVD